MSAERRLVVVSNRLPLGDPSGGLVVALHDALVERGGLWVGTSGELTDEPGTRLKEHEGQPYTRLSFDLTEAEHRDYYLGYANSVLWPLFHGRADLMEMRAGYLDTYLEVNERLARMLAGVIRRDDVLWVQDYHFLPLARKLRELGVMNRIGFFLHIPFPSVYDMMAMPDTGDFLGWLGAFDLVGLQAQRDVARLIEAYRSRTDSELLPDGTLKIDGQQVEARSFPIGIDTARFRDLAEARGRRAELHLTAGEKLMIGVDRLDYSKGIPNRFRAFGQFLDTHPSSQGRVALLQIAPPTREAVGAYQEIREETEALAGRINGAHAELNWTPIRYIHRSIPREILAGLFRQADIGLVTPLADGMNLVAKEFVAAQDPADPGVLILSNYAGAVEQMTEAMTVNPYDEAQMAEVMAAALEMPLAERQRRHAAMMEGLLREDVAWWARTYLSVLIDGPRVYGDTRPATSA